MGRDIKEAVKMFKAIKADLPAFYDDALKEVGLRYLSLVIPLTPVTENHYYKVGRKGHEQYVPVKGGALRRGWIGEVEKADPDADYPEVTAPEMAEYVKSLSTAGNKITIANTVHYASYVNYGHLQEPGRYVPAIETKNEKGEVVYGAQLVKHWVPGQKFKEKAENAIGPYLPKVYDSTLQKYYRKWNKR